MQSVLNHHSATRRPSAAAPTTTAAESPPSVCLVGVGDLPGALATASPSGPVTPLRASLPTTIRGTADALELVGRATPEPERMMNTNAKFN